MSLATPAHIRSTATRRACVVLVAALATFLHAGLAPAATVTRSGSVLTYSATPGEANQVVVSLDEDYWAPGYIRFPVGRAYVFVERGEATLVAGPGCGSLASWPTAPIVYCPATGISGLSLDAGDRDDELEVHAPTQARLAGGPGADRLTGGPGNDALDGGSGADELSGGSGIDWVTYDGSAVGVTVTVDNLAGDGAPSEGDNIRTDVEDVTGTRFDDSLTGSPGANSLYGAEGDDTLRGGAGPDMVYGEAGADWLSGEAGDDWLVGGFGDDRLFGGEGDDELPGGPGGLADADQLSGGIGRDRVGYEMRPSGVRVSLDGLANDGKPSEHERPGEHDNVWADVEDVTGTRFDDVLSGSPSTNALVGLEGNDLLTGGPGDDRIPGGPGGPNDADTVSGGDGVDWVSYYGRANGVTVALDDVADDGETGEGDNVRSDVEAVTGTSYVDVLIGNAAANSLFGGEGDDTLTGGAGADRLLGEAGDDTLYARDGVTDVSVDGGAGTDRAQVDGSDPLLSIDHLF